MPETEKRHRKESRRNREKKNHEKHFTSIVVLYLQELVLLGRIAFLVSFILIC